METIILYRLSDFSGFLEVAVALHLAYALIREVSHATARRFERHSEHLKRYFHDLDDAAQETIRPLIAELDVEIFKLDRRLEPWVSAMMVVSMLAAIYGIALLAYMGFSPEARFPLIALVALLAPATMPIVFFLLASYRTGATASSRAGEKSDKALAKFNALLAEGRLTGKGRYVKT